MNMVNCTEFSYIAGVSKAAIVKAKKRGEIIQEADGKYYDIENVPNAAYLQKLIDREAAKKAPKPKKQKTKEVKKKLKKINPKTVKKESSKKTTEKKTKKKPPASPPGKSKTNPRADIDMKIKEITLKTAEVKYHQLLGDIIERDSIQFVWNKIYKSATYFQDFGQRYAGEWAAALGITESDKILDLEKEIDKATEKFMEAFTETVAKEI